MAYVPGGHTFPTKIDDSGTATVNNAYWIGETEVTWELWKAVYDWAVGNGYSFQNPGRQGGDENLNANDPVGTIQHPVTLVSWRDVMVWCNALTEWYNAMNGTTYTVVYKNVDVPIRDSRNSNASVCDAVLPDAASTGFRLLSSYEWELAARWRDDDTNTVEGYKKPWFTKGDSASHASADIDNKSATETVAWYAANSSGRTQPVKGKTPNSLGLYDMSGNVWEFCFTAGRSGRIAMGSSWHFGSYYLSIPDWYAYSPDYFASTFGFRFAKLAD